MSVKLIAKRRLAFRNPEDKKFVTVMPHVFETVPDWVRKDPIFQWGVSDGTITVADPPPQAGVPEVPKEEPKEEVPKEEPKEEVPKEEPKPKAKSAKGQK